MASRDTGADWPPIVVTGAGGWLGTALMAHSAHRFGPGWTKNVRLFGSAARTITAPDGSDVILRALDTITGADVEDALVVHLAYLTKEKVEQFGEAGFTHENRRIDDRLLAALACARPRALFVASSGAAALAERGEDLHPYGLGKLRQEQRFIAWGVEASVPVLAGRIFNLAGPYMNKIDAYAVGSFITQALAEGHIRINATVPVFRSYLHVDDVCNLILTALNRGAGRDRPIDIAGMELLEMDDIARAVARAIGEPVAIERGAVNHALPSLYVGNAVDTRILAMELDIELADFSAQVAATLDWLRKNA